MISGVTLTMAVELVIILFIMPDVMNASNATGSDKNDVIVIIIVLLH